MTVAIVKYNAGNVLSVAHALRRLGVEPLITDDPHALMAVERIVFPGVGEAGSAMHFLREKKLDEVLRTCRCPVLGICLGLQLLCTFSEERATECLHIFSQKVRRFPPHNKVPHVGWNCIGQLEGPLFKGVEDGSFVYFVHSYYAELGKATCARTDYIVEFSAALREENFYAVQFHPEKSGAVGELILKNFLSEVVQ